MINEKRKRRSRNSIKIAAAAAAVFILISALIVRAILRAPEKITDPGICLMPNINVTFSKLNNSNFYYSNGMTYYQDGEKKSSAGIDVSFAQKEIDWMKVRDAGIDFAMVRAGYRGYESGLLNKDEFFDRNMTGAQRAGIETGVYFYSQAVNEAEAVEEADFVLSMIDKYSVTYPVAFDWEPVTSDTARTDTLSGEELNRCALAFCRRIEERGYRPIIYASLNLLREKYDKYSVDVISDYDLWLAEYKRRPEFPYQFKMWQYSDEGTVDGIDYPTDINLFYE